MYAEPQEQTALFPGQNSPTLPVLGVRVGPDTSKICGKGFSAHTHDNVNGLDYWSSIVKVLGSSSQFLPPHVHHLCLCSDAKLLYEEEDDNHLSLYIAFFAPKLGIEITILAIPLCWVCLFITLNLHRKQVEVNINRKICQRLITIQQKSLEIYCRPLEYFSLRGLGGRWYVNQSKFGKFK